MSRHAKKHQRALSLQACAVNVVRTFPTLDEGEQAEAVKKLAAKRGIQWRWGHEITEALAVARRYEVIRG